MPFYLAPIGNEQQSDSSGVPLSGGLIYTYAAGTSTPAATYTDDTGGTPQANPIVLNASGLPDNPIWLTGGTSYKFVFKTSADVTLRTVDDISGVNDPASIAAATEWVAYTGAPTYISATSLSLVGDQTNTFQVGRRIRTTNTGGTVYSFISASSYDSGTGLTTITVVNDSGSLDAGLSVVSYGILSATNRSGPQDILQMTLQAASGATVDITGIPVGVREFAVVYKAVSSAGTGFPAINLGTSGGMVGTGYEGGATECWSAGNPATNASTTNVQIRGATPAAGDAVSGVIRFVNVNGTDWAWSGTLFINSATDRGVMLSGYVPVGGTLDRVRFSLSGGDTYDAGNFGLVYKVA